MLGACALFVERAERCQHGNKQKKTQKKHSRAALVLQSLAGGNNFTLKNRDVAERKDRREEKYVELV